MAREKGKIKVDTPIPFRIRKTICLPPTEIAKQVVSFGSKKFIPTPTIISRSEGLLVARIGIYYFDNICCDYGIFISEAIKQILHRSVLAMASFLGLGN